MPQAPDIRDRMERTFEAMTRRLIRRPYVSLALVLLCTLALISQVPRITVDTSTEGFLHEDDPALIAYNGFRDQYGRDEMIIMALSPPGGVFERDFLTRLRAFHEDLKASVPHVDDITSLINARNTRGEGDALVVGDLIEDIPEDEAGLALIRERALRNPLYRNLLISEDAQVTTVVIKTSAYSGDALSVEDALGEFGDGPAAGGPPVARQYLTDAENAEIVDAAREVMARHEGPDFPIALAGSPVVTDTLKKTMMRDMRRFILLCAGVIALLLWIMFRRASGVALPLLTVVLSLLGTVGLMALMGVPLKLPSQILPSFLLAVCVGDAVHILAIFYQRFAETGDRHEAIVYAIGHSGLAVVMTSLTTAAGLFSFSGADIAPVSDLGIYSGIGVMIALLLTLTLLPPLLAIIPVRRHHGGLSQSSTLDGLLTTVADFSTSRPRLIAGAWGLLLAVSIFGAARLEFSHYVLEWLPEGSPVREATVYVDRVMRGSVSVEVVVDTGRENGLYDPGLLDAIDALGAELSLYRGGDVFVGKTLALPDVLKEINQALNGNDPMHYTIPSDEALVAQELLLFENSGSDDLEDSVDSRFSKARLTVKVPFLDAVAYGEFMDTLEHRVEETLGPMAKTTVTGMIPLISRTLYGVMRSMAESYSIALIVIGLMMVAIIGDLRMGLISIVPNVAPIVVAMGFMGLMGYPLDMFTMLVGSIAMGISDDDTIHFMHNFRRSYARTGDVRASVHETMQGTGRAMFVTSCVLASGFLVFTVSSMDNLYRFGLLTGLTVFLALIAEYTLGPALLTLGLGGRNRA